MKNNNNAGKTDWNTIVIGAGQAGLSAGYFLKMRGTDFTILNAEENIGDSWRKRWDSLHLFTPAQVDGLPGYPFPAPRGTFPSKDDMARYLTEYSGKFNLPVRNGEKAELLSARQPGFEISTSKGKLRCENVIIATGTNPVPHIPGFAADVDKKIHQIHSSQYVNPDGLPEGKVLVVGAGTSGMEIAIELAGTRQTMISGQPTFHIPDPLFRYTGNFYWWFINNVMTVSTPIGRKAKKKIIKGGAPLIKVSARDLIPAGVRRVPRVVGVEDGNPKLGDGQTIPVSTIVWATGFKPDFSWIDPDITDAQTGWPLHNRGVSQNVKGMYFVGMIFQYSLASGLVGGVGRDAAYIVDHIHQHTRGKAD
jgi:putative flavoprotein involved in K+ transport